MEIGEMSRKSPQSELVRKQKMTLKFDLAEMNTFKDKNLFP